jgi:hypothetical protein
LAETKIWNSDLRSGFQLGNGFSEKKRIFLYWIGRFGHEYMVHDPKINNFLILNSGKIDKIDLCHVPSIATIKLMLLAQTNYKNKEQFVMEEWKVRMLTFYLLLLMQ